MSKNEPDVFQNTIQAANIWLKEIREVVGPGPNVAWKALAAVLHTIRDRVPLELAAHFGAQLPLLVRGAYYDQFTPASQPRSWRSLDEFLGHIQQQMGDTRPVDPAAAARAVFAVIDHHLDPGAVEKMKHALPEPVQLLWDKASPGAKSARHPEART